MTRLFAALLIVLVATAYLVTDVSAQFSQDDLDAAREAGRRFGTFVGQNILLIGIVAVLVYLVGRSRRRK